MSQVDATENSRHEGPCRDQIQGLIKEYFPPSGQGILRLSVQAKSRLQMPNTAFFNFPNRIVYCGHPGPI